MKTKLIFICMLIGVLSRLSQAQCPPNFTSLFTFRDRTINVPLTDPLCLACRFLNPSSGLPIPFNDGIWTNEGTTLTNGDFNGNVSLTSDTNTMYLTMDYPASVINVGNTLRCSSASAGRQHIITVGKYIFLDPVVTPNGIVGVAEGSNLTLVCSDPGNIGPVRYVWINESNDDELTAVVNNENQLPLNLTFNNINKTTSGDYTCRSLHSDLPGLYLETTVTINIIVIDIYISQNKSSFSVGNDATINCTYDSSVLANVQWTKNGHLLTPNNNNNVTVQPGYSQLILTSLETDDTGCYQCIINSANSTCVNLTVRVSPVATTAISTTTITTAIGSSTVINSQGMASTNSLSPSSSNSESSTMITISPTISTNPSKQTDRTVVWVVSGIVMGLLVIAISGLSVAMAYYCYRQTKSTGEESTVRGTSFKIEEYDFGDNEGLYDEKLKEAFSSSAKSTDQLLSSDKFEMTDTHEDHSTSNGTNGNALQSPPPPLPPPYKISDFGCHEEINVGLIQVEKEKVLYSRVNKPSSIKHPKNYPSSTPPPIVSVNIQNDDLFKSELTFSEPPSLPPSSSPPPPPSRLSPNHASSLDRPPTERVIYTEITVSPKKENPNKKDEKDEQASVDAEKVVYSDISKLSKSPSGRIVCADSEAPPGNPLYADLNLLRSQNRDQNQGDSSASGPAEKVVYAEIDSIRKPAHR